MKIHTVTKRGENRAYLIETMRRRGIDVTSSASSVILSTKFSIDDPDDHEIIIATAGDLGVIGLSEMDLCGEIGAEYLRFIGYGFAKPDDAPHFRLAYTDQPRGETIWFIHKPIPSDPYRFILMVECNKKGGKELKALNLSTSEKIGSQCLLAVRRL